MLITREELALQNISIDQIYRAGELDLGKVRQTARLHVHAMAELADDGIRIRGRLQTHLEGECDRCIAPVEIPISRDFDLIYRPVASIARDEEIEISGDDLDVGFYAGAGVELSDLVREQVILSVPMKLVCSADCKGFCPGCGANLNTEQCRCERTRDQSPFESLRRQ